MFCSADDQKIDDMLSTGYNQLLQQIKQFQHNGSAWAVDYFMAIDLDKNFPFIFAKFIHLNSRGGSNVIVY